MTNRLARITEDVIMSVMPLLFDSSSASNVGSTNHQIHAVIGFKGYDDMT